MTGHLIHFLVGSTVQKSAAVEIRFKCPACGAANATGAAYDHTEQFKLFHLIPIGTAHSTWVKCSACGFPSRSEIPAAELARRAPGEVNRFIRQRVPPVLIALLIGGGLFALVPPFGLVFSGLALGIYRKFDGWTRRVAFIEFGIGLVMGLIFLIALMMPETPPAKPTFPPRRHASPSPGEAKP